ncbi:hypothetical protein FOZ63_029144 [Perkinsus olseni]|uniref:Uncharacterized protein n=1 Tax=Perkinsus olseni TaxID=32597 RepID=A0A7J6RT97_PEROL|nr:hypothetical protein FOZ63_029144 [Perkinsus olseni]
MALRALSRFFGFQTDSGRIEIFCRYGKASHSCFLESGAVPVYAFEYAVEFADDVGAVPISMTRGCTLSLIPNTVEQGDDFTELQRLKPDYYTRDQTLMARGPPRICEHSFEYAKIENDVRVVDRDIYTGRYDRIEKQKADDMKLLFQGTTYHYFSQIPRMEILITDGQTLRVFDEGVNRDPAPLKWLSSESHGGNALAIDKNRYAVFIHYYMLVINIKTKETTVLRMNGNLQQPKRRLYFENMIAGLSPVERFGEEVRECCPSYDGSLRFDTPVCTRAPCSEERVTRV